MSECLQAALEYESMGFSVIPCNPSSDEDKGKRPLIKWEPYQKERASADKIKEWWAKWPQAMIGVVTGEISGLFVVDADSAQAKEKIEEILPESFECPICQTPRGWHYYFKWQAGLGNSNNGVLHSRGSGGFAIAPPSKRSNGDIYQWVSPIEKSPLIIPPIFIYNILNIKYVDDGQQKQNMEGLQQTVYNRSTICLQDGSRNDSLNRILFHLYRGGMSFADGTYIANFIGDNTLDKDGKKRLKMDPKTIELTNLSAWKAVTSRSLSEEVKEWVCLQSGYFLSTDFWKTSGFDYKMSTRNDRKNLWIIMNRLVDQELIEKHPSKSGCYRKRDQNLVEIDIEEEPGPEWDILFPLGFEKLVHIFEKQIIVIYSGPDGGKSGFLFDLMKRNIERLNGKINYFSSEMGSQELRSRLSLSGINFKDWKKGIKFYERARGFSDVVKPEEINIIDYLSIHEEFSLIGKYIDEIWERLHKGIAIIVLQSKYNSDLPRGAEFALEKARLGFTLLKQDKGHLCKITKAKNWKDNMMNPNHKVKKFLIYKGCQIIEKSPWITEEEIKIEEEF